MMNTTQQIDMPGVCFLLGSVDLEDTNNDYQIRPQLWENGPRWFFENKVRPYAEAGVKKILVHRPLGEWIINNTHQEIDTLWHMIRHPNPDVRAYAEEMLRECARFFARYPDITPYIYIGAINQTELRGFHDDGQVKKWAQLLTSAIQPWEEVGQLYGVEFQYIMDNTSQFDISSPEWSAYCVLEGMMPNRVHMEANPSTANPDQAGTSSWLGEDLFQQRKGGFQPGQIGKLTRVIFGPNTYDDYWPQSRGGLASFIATCHAEGHHCVIADDMQRRSGHTISQLRDVAQLRFDDAVQHMENRMKTEVSS